MQLKNEPLQKQILAPQMIQSMQILQFSNLQLQEYLENLSLENPMMEFTPPASHYEARQEQPRHRDEQNQAYERIESDRLKDPWGNIAAGETLAEILLFQIRGMSLSGQERRILTYLIHNLESSGYLPVSVEDTRQVFGCSTETVERMLAILQNLEPSGVGARNVSECLCIQLCQNHPGEALALEIARNHLELLGKNQMKQLSRLLKTPLEEVLRACDLIRRLNPRPGAAFGDGRNLQYIHPELSVLQDRTGFQVVLNDHDVPAVQMNGEYLSLLQESEDGLAIAYLTKKKAQLEWVQQCILQRNKTLLSLGELILENQLDFFRKGPGNLRQFSQAEAARLLGVHESTISRAIRDKHLQCLWGTFPLQHFFPQGLQQKDVIRSQIRQLIAKENPLQPLSDQAIADALAQQELRVSKRLVSKYRNELGIPDASIRQKYEI